MKKFLIIPHLDEIEESLALAEEYGFGFEYNDFFSPDMLDDKQRLESTIARYKANPLPDRCTMHGDFFDVLIFSEDKLIREISEKRIHQSIAAALEIGAEGVVFHTNHNPMLTADFYVNNWLKCNVDFWSAVTEQFPQINIYIENMFDTSPDMLARLAKELSGCKNFGVCLDYAHAAAFGGGTDRWISMLAPYIKHMHINDNDLKDDLHLAVGDGQIDWLKFKEYYFRYFTDCTVLIETSDISRQRKSAEYLKNIGII